jgi:hypothetical protein
LAHFLALKRRGLWQLCTGPRRVGDICASAGVLSSAPW